LAEAQARGLYPYDGRDLPTELVELHERVARVEEEHVTKAKKLAALVGEASKALVDLSLPPIREILHVPREAREVLKVAGVILECL
jgi:hypothetical protein